MTEIRNYEYTSILAPYIRDYIADKRNMGYIYNVKAYQLKRIDEYWIKNGYDQVCMTAEMLDKWLCCFPSESRSSHSSRISAVKGFGEYLRTLGIACYVPLFTIRSNHVTVHILSHSEIVELFDVIDNYSPRTTSGSDHRMANEYPIIFRLYYCCGLRNDEVCSLKTENIDLKTGIITIMDGKNHKDRLVYLPEDLRLLMYKYLNYIKNELRYAPEWMFPGRNKSNHIGKSQIDKIFSSFWNKTLSAATCDKKPTPHCLRHTYVVDRINRWILEGKDINVLFPYLSKYLGHKDFDETFYYYHLVDDAFKIVRQKDTKSNVIIPEVKRI